MKQPYAFHFGMGTCRGEMREVQGRSLPSTFHLSLSTSARQSRRAFTLIELMGVMAIIGILAAVTLPSMISKIESARTENEDANLQEIARALVEGIKRQGQFPDPAGSWASIAQNYTSLGTNALANALPNNDAPDNNPRRIVFSDALTTYLGETFTQPATGRPAPAVGASLIIYILSSSKNGVPLSTGVIPPADIANWTKTFNPTNGYIPAPTSVFGAGNERRGEFLHVKAMDVRSLFCAVTLTDFPKPTGGQTTSSGSGFTPNTPYQGQAAGCSFNFTAPSPNGAVVVGFDIDPPTATTSVAVGSKSMIPRTGATTTGLAGVIPPPDRNIASLNARNTLAAKLLTAPPAPYAAAARAADPAAAEAAIRDANIDELVNSTVPAPTLTTLQNTYNSAKSASDAAQAAAEAEKIRDPANETAPDNATLDSTAAEASQATASAKAALETAEGAASAQTTANANASANAYSSAVDAATRAAAIPGATPQSVASEAANAAANAAAAQVVTTPATFSMTIDQPPWWTIAGLTGQQMPTVGNNQTFYVIKGTALTLYAAGDALPADPILTVQINADSKFEHFNGSWTRVD